MQRVKLSERISYVALSDDEGSFGLLTFDNGSEKPSITEVNSREEFASALNRYRLIEASTL